MSAYIVDKETIDLIVTYAYSRTVGGECIRNEFGVEDRNAFGQLLWDMNYSAVNQRYNENDKAPEYVYTPQTHVHFPKTYHALRSFLYQCAEGDVYGSVNYRKVEELKSRLTDQIVQNLPEYAENF